MLNFRKLKADYSPSVIKEGRQLFEKNMVSSGKILALNPETIRLSCSVKGNFDHAYSCEIEIDRQASTTIDADCDCSHKYDCHHISASLFFLEENLNNILIDYSKEGSLDVKKGDKAAFKTLKETVKEAQTKESERLDKKYQKELIQEYLSASEVLGESPFFLPEEELSQDKAELAILFPNLARQIIGASQEIDVQLSLRLPFRSKPLNILNIRDFIDSVRYGEPLYIGNKRFFFSSSSFDPVSGQILQIILDAAKYPEIKDEKHQKTAYIDSEALGMLLAKAYELKKQGDSPCSADSSDEADLPALPCLYSGSIEEPLRFSNSVANICFSLEYLEVPSPKLLLKPTLALGVDETVAIEEVRLFECAKPGILHQNTYYAFPAHIRRRHLRNLEVLRNITIPEPLFGTFVENSLPELLRFSEVANKELINRFITLPYVNDLKAECDIHYLNGELEASLSFLYDNIKVPATKNRVLLEHIKPFVTKQGILARNLTEEQNIIRALFQDFFYNPSEGVFSVKNDKKIVEFMTETIPAYQHKVSFNCPENLLDQFVYDNTSLTLHLRESKHIDSYEVDLKVKGHLNGTSVDLLWECLMSKKAFIELPKLKKTAKKKNGDDASCSTANKILVFDLEKLTPLVHLLDEIGIKELTDHSETRPLWSLASLEPCLFEGLPIEFSMTEGLRQIQQQILGNVPLASKPIPKHIKADFRSYQAEGVFWLERLRYMHLNGVLADDMGLGKTLQSIAAITQCLEENPKLPSIVICPTSLVYNWKEEFSKFNPKLKALPVDGTPTQRKKLQNNIKDYQIIITSYSLLQKDIDFYKTLSFGYAILDEAQHIKNRGTRNAKSVKQIQSRHRLILTGTPIENSLEELWSLFDFLMPGLLSSYDRFVEKYIRPIRQAAPGRLEALRKKVTPFILRRMKSDVLEDLPPVSHILYHCHMSETQKELYQSYAASAREELSELVKKEGFDKVQIHVLATLTRLKQICCHPAIFAKDRPETGDSSKYEMLLELLQTLISSKHKTVIFSQYTRMLGILRQDLIKMGIRFEYFDGTSKNRLAIVKKFNEDETIPVFLVSLKAGGSGLNLVGADTIIHYDMWWNPAVENQATDRVHRIGQKKSVSAYKLVTLGSIEEKILELQNRKKGLVQQVVTCDDEALSKLTWAEVLELLQT